MNDSHLVAEIGHPAMPGGAHGVAHRVHMGGCVAGMLAGWIVMKFGGKAMFDRTLADVIAGRRKAHLQRVIRTGFYRPKGAVGSGSRRWMLPRDGIMSLTLGYDDGAGGKGSEQLDVQIP